MILLIDSYDSFTNNLAHLLKENSNQRVVTIHNDSFTPVEYQDFYTNYLPQFEYVVIGPGPGHPAIEKDVGIISWLLKKYRNNSEPPSTVVPILGICLGFQSICHEFGNQVTKLEDVKHGQVYKIYPLASELFPSTDLLVQPFDSVRYHSLYVSELNDEIIPLAYCYEPNEDRNGRRVLLAVKHKSLPFYGVQYHPESICSSNGNELIANFTKIATKYNQEHRPNVFNANIDDDENHAVHEVSLVPGGKLKSTDRPVIIKQFQLDDNISPTDVADYFHRNKKDFILLNSASSPGEWSVIGLYIDQKTEVFTHSLDDPSKLEVSVHKSHERKVISLGQNESVWSKLSDRMTQEHISRAEVNKRQLNSRDLPFIGGFMGLISYEEGQHILTDDLERFCDSNTPDMKMTFIERSVVYDHVTKDWFIVSINRDDDTSWTENLFNEIISNQANMKIDTESIPFTVSELCNEEDKYKIKFDFPSQEIYNEQFAKCQEYLHSGDSYELCLTTQLKITLPEYVQPWDIYKILTLKKNPSPFSCFMEYDDCVLISSSPERFLSWKDDADGKKTIELRPIKGTVRNTPEVDIEAATKILKTPKEMGENLMIVDLIRHDLYQFTDDVKVSQLMGVEEYKTVYQLVSVIQGKLAEEGYHGIDILHSSLPPGSMTGAPKKRSVELLKALEDMQTISSGRRGIYSGVVGYWSITDDADWSVIIRSVFRYNNDLSRGEDTNIWRIGAGGAITVLSDVEGEWEEMKVKLSSALQAFQ